MKKILLLILALSVLFVIGCGSSGGGGSTASTIAPGGGQAGNFTLNLHEAVADASVDSRHSLAITADHARVVIRKIVSTSIMVDVCSQYDDDGNCTGTWTPTPRPVTTEVYKKVVDAQINGGSVSVDAPVGDTYTFDVLTYAMGTPNQMSKFGTANVLVVSGGSATITVSDILPYVDIPSPIISDQNIRVTFGAAMTPVRAHAEMVLRLPSNISTATVQINGASISLTAPHTTTQTDTTLFCDVKYFISDNMLDTGEKFADWVRTNTWSSTFVPLATVTVPNLS